MSSKIDTGKKIMLITGWYIVVMSILWVFATDIVFVSDFQAYTGSSFGIHFCFPHLCEHLYNY